MEVQKIWDLYPTLAREVKDMHQRVGLVASGRDTDHDFEVGQLALIVTWPENEQDAVLAGAGGLLHSTDRILEVTLGLRQQTVSTVPEENIRFSVIERLVSCTDITDAANIKRV